MLGVGGIQSFTDIIWFLKKGHIRFTVKYWLGAPATNLSQKPSESMESHILPRNTPIELIELFLMCVVVTIFTFLTHFLLSSKCPNTRSNHDMALSYLSSYLLSYLFTLQSHTIKTRKADSIGIPIKNYLFRRRSHHPRVLLIGFPQSIEVQLIIGIIPTMWPCLVIRLPIQVLVNDSLIYQ